MIYDPNPSRDGIKWTAHALVEKYDEPIVRDLTKFLGYEPKSADFKRFSIKPNAVAEAPGNLLCINGLANMTNLITGLGGQALNSTRTFLGVGATSTAATAADTALGANGGSAWYQVVDSAPTRTTTSQTNDTIQTVSTFTSANGNFAWQEWGLGFTTAAITSSATLASVGTGAALINHKIASLGTKASGAAWAFTVTIQLS
jgi:hypothetical protein